MVWLNQIIFWIPFLVAVFILVKIWRKLVLQGQVEERTLKRAVILVVALFVVRDILRVIFIYFLMKADPLGSYLLPGKGTNFFSGVLWTTFEPLILGILVGILLSLVAILIKRYTSKPWFETFEIWIIFLTSFLVGFPGIFVLLLASFLLMIIWQIFRKAERVTLAPFLILVCLAQLVLNNFQFYQNFLERLHLI